MGHRVSTLSDRSDGSGGRTFAPPALSRAFLLAMIVTVAAAASSSCPPTTARPAGRWASSPAAAAAASSCCFVAAAEPPRGPQSPPAGVRSTGGGHTSGRFRFRRRPWGGVAGAAATAAASDVGTEPFASAAMHAGYGGGDRQARRPPPSSSPSSLWLFRRNSDSEPSGGTWRQQRSARRVPLTELTRRRKSENQPGKPVRTVGNMPPHLAAAFGTAEVTENGELILDDDEYERRKLEWAQRYTDVTTLRTTFGTNRNQLWGDLDPEATRRLYHTLLPRALMGLYDMGLMRPSELAPLAYEARNAAKKYARERCAVPGRVASMAYDGFRSLRDYGKWNHEGLSWDQIWDKYERQVSDEFDFEDHEEDELTKQICLRILERSCRTNAAVDKFLLGKGGGSSGSGRSPSSTSARSSKKRDRKEQMEMAEISAKLERDVHELLFEGAQKSNRLFQPTREQRRKLKERKRELKREEVVSRKELRATEKAFLRALRNEEKRKREMEGAPESSGGEDAVNSQVSGQDHGSRKVRLTRQEVWFLRTLVGTKKKIKSFRTQTPLIRKLHGTTEPPASTGAAAGNGQNKKKEEEIDLIEVSAPAGLAKKIIKIKKEDGTLSSSVTTPDRRSKRWLGRGSALPRRKKSVHPTEEEVFAP